MKRARGAPAVQDPDLLRHLYEGHGSRLTGKQSVREEYAGVELQMELLLGSAT